LTVKEVNMQSIRAWANAHPHQIPNLLAANPSYVFFKLKPSSEAAPDGALGVPLSAGYSVAVDPHAIPLGSLMWLAATTPDGRKLVRPVAAQDTGGAIKGGVRADVYFGTGDTAGAIAGHMKQAGRLWLIWPKGRAVPRVI
jgi:membrane-bound lytic murein transglycosylase A